MASDVLARVEAFATKAGELFDKGRALSVFIRRGGWRRDVAVSYTFGRDSPR